MTVLSDLAVFFKLYVSHLNLFFYTIRYDSIRYRELYGCKDKSIFCLMLTAAVQSECISENSGVLETHDPKFCGERSAADATELCCAVEVVSAAAAAEMLHRGGYDPFYTDVGLMRHTSPCASV